MRMRHALSLADCQEAINTGVEAASAAGLRVTIAVVDDFGVALYLVRMDEASPASVDTALAKAKSAALTGLSTKLLEQIVEKRPGVATMGRVAVEGGIPLLFSEQRVGAVGVSGAQSTEDAEIAEIVAERIKSQLK